MSDFDWHAYGVVVGSSYRKRVLLSLRTKPRAPHEIGRTLKLPSSHVSTTLKLLQQLDLVECMTPELRKGRIYTLTVSGRRLVEKIEAG